MATTIFLHADLLKDVPDPDQPTLENPLYKDFIFVGQVFGEYFSANTPEIRDEFQRNLKNAGGRVPPADQRSRMRVMPLNGVRELTLKEMQDILGL